MALKRLALKSTLELSKIRFQQARSESIALQAA